MVTGQQGKVTYASTHPVGQGLKREDHVARVDHEAVEQVAVDDEVARHTRQQAVKVSVLAGDRKSTRLNSSHQKISYAVFCLKKKKRGEWMRGEEEEARGGRRVKAMCYTS